MPSFAFIDDVYTSLNQKDYISIQVKIVFLRKLSTYSVSATSRSFLRFDDLLQFLFSFRSSSGYPLRGRRLSRSLSPCERSRKSIRNLDIGSNHRDLSNPYFRSSSDEGLRIARGDYFQLTIFYIRFDPTSIPFLQSISFKLGLVFSLKARPRALPKSLTIHARKKLPTR